MISIIIALHNKRPYIEATIRSVQQQRRADWELIVVENNSRDDGPKCVRKLAESDARIHLIDASATAHGPGAARNIGLDHATGEWVLFLDADDLIEPDHLDLLLKVAAANPTATVVAGGWQEFVEGRDELPRTVKRPPGGASAAASRSGLIAAPPWAIHAAIVKRDLVSENRWHPELDRLLAEDICFWYRIVKRGCVALSEGNGAIYRMQTAGCRTQNTADQLDAWMTGVSKAVEVNLSLLSELNERPSAAECGALVRLYSRIFNQACEGQATGVRDRSLREAEHWLSEYRRREPGFQPSMSLRALLGIRAFETWMQLFKRR